MFAQARISRYVFATLITCLLGTTTRAGSGNVMPPSARPQGWSLQDMAEAVAYFSDSFNDLDFYPDTPFEVLYRTSPQNPTGENTFVVKPGTWLYAKFFFIDDAPEVLGDFPDDPADAADYIFNPEQLGGHDLEIEVDGKSTPLGADNVSAPVPLVDAPDPGAEHLIQVGAFISPLNKGTHTVILRAVFDGDAWDLIEPGFSISFEVTYTIIVE